MLTFSKAALRLFMVFCQLVEFLVICAPWGHRPFVKLPDESMEQVLGDIRAMRLRGDTGIPPQQSLEGSRIKNSQITTSNDF